MASSTGSSPRPPASSTPARSPSPRRPFPPGLRVLENRRFRSLALWLALVPVAGNHLWTTIVLPALDGAVFTDFEVYLRGARTLAAGQDPYAAFFASRVPDFSFNQAYIYPPLTAWLLAPLTPLGDPLLSWLMQGLLQGSLVLFVLLIFRGLGWWRRDEILLAALLVMAFLPVRHDLFTDQVNLLLLLGSAVLLLAWVRGDRWWGGLALGAGVAVKLIQAPLGLLLVWGRRARMLSVALATGGMLTLLAAPAFLPEYLFRVLPRIGHASGFRENSTPSAFLERLFYPGSFYGGSPGGYLAGGLGLLISAAVILVTWRALGGRPRRDVEGRALEVAAAVAATPLVLAVNYHQSLELLPIVVLIHAGLRRRSSALLGAAAAGWLLPGPVHAAFLAAIGAGFSNDLGLRIWNELQLVGALLLWMGCLLALVGKDSDQQPHVEAR